MPLDLDALRVQQQIAELFGTTQQNVSPHLRNVYEEDELDPTATHKEHLSVRREDGRGDARPIDGS